MQKLVIYFTVGFFSLLGASVALHLPTLTHTLLVVGLVIVGIFFAVVISMLIWTLLTSLIGFRLKYNLKRIGYIHDDPQENRSNYFSFEFFPVVPPTSAPSLLEVKIMLNLHKILARKKQGQNTLSSLIAKEDKVFIYRKYSKNYLAQKLYESYLAAFSNPISMEGEPKYPLASYIFVSKIEPNLLEQDMKRNEFFYRNHYNPEEVFLLKDVSLTELEAMDGLPVSWSKKILCAE